MSAHDFGRGVGKAVQELTEAHMRSKANQLILEKERVLYLAGPMKFLTGGFSFLLFGLMTIILALDVSGLAYNESGDKILIHGLIVSGYSMGLLCLVWFLYVRSWKLELQESGVLEQWLFHKRFISFDELHQAAKKKQVKNNGVAYCFPTAGRSLKVNISQTYIGDYFAECVGKEADIKDMPGIFDTKKLGRRISGKLLIIFSPCIYCFFVYVNSENPYHWQYVILGRVVAIPLFILGIILAVSTYIREK